MSEPKFSYVLSDETRFDIDEIWDYIAQDSPDAADRYIDELHHVFSLLAANPLMGANARNSRPVFGSRPTKTTIYSTGQRMVVSKSIGCCTEPATQYKYLISLSICRTKPYDTR
jgi:plasmid stabilization system protein ParE